MKTLLVTFGLVGAAVAVSVSAQGRGEGQHDLTRTEVQQRAIRMFQTLDANHDGSVTKAEADQVFGQFQAARGGERTRGGARTKQMIDQAFAQAQALTQAQFEAQALARFEAQDTNKDGFVSAAERQQSAAQGQSPQPKPAQ